MNENDKIATLESRISNLNSICKVYEKIINDDDTTLKQVAKILVPYKNEDNLQFYKISDIVDDINDVFNGFNSIYNKACDDDNNINLSK